MMKDKEFDNDVGRMGTGLVESTFINKQKNRKGTFIKNLANILCNDPLALIVKAEYQYMLQSEAKVDIIDAATMIESIALLEENTVFSNMVGWTYEKVSEISDTEDFIIYGDLHDSIIGTYVVLYLCVTDGHTVENVEEKLNETT